MKATGCRQWAWILALACLAGCNGARDEAREPAADDATTSAVTLATLKTADWDALLAAHQGKIVVVDCWATWCAPCIEGFPKLVALHHEYADHGVACISVSLDGAGAHDAALKFLEREQATFANFRVDDENEHAWWDKWNIKSLPVVLVFDRQGQLTRKFDMDDPDNQFTHEDVTKLVAEMVEAN